MLDLWEDRFDSDEIRAWIQRLPDKLRLATGRAAADPIWTDERRHHRTRSFAFSSQNAGQNGGAGMVRSKEGG